MIVYPLKKNNAVLLENCIVTKNNTKDQNRLFIFLGAQPNDFLKVFEKLG
jgi:hypothetical protein